MLLTLLQQSSLDIQAATKLLFLLATNKNLHFLDIYIMILYMQYIFFRRKRQAKPFRNWQHF